MARLKTVAGPWLERSRDFFSRIFKLFILSGGMKPLRLSWTWLAGTTFKKTSKTERFFLPNWAV